MEVEALMRQFASDAHTAKAAGRTGMRVSSWITEVASWVHPLMWKLETLIKVAFKI